MIISGDLDNATPSYENNELTETFKQFWETEAIGISHDTTDTNQHDRSMLFLSSIHFEDGHYELMLTFPLILVCVIIN